MAKFLVERTTSLSVTESWARLTDWERHGDLIPLTHITRTGEGMGSRFTARTALGPVGFDDPMQVTVWKPPEQATAGHCRIEKTGRVIAGWAELTVVATPDGTRVSWLEDVAVRHTGRWLNLPSRVISTRLFGRLVDNLLA